MTHNTNEIVFLSLNTNLIILINGDNLNNISQILIILCYSNNFKLYEYNMKKIEQMCSKNVAKTILKSILNLIFDDAKRKKYKMQSNKLESIKRTLREIIYLNKTRTVFLLHTKVLIIKNIN